MATHTPVRKIAVLRANAVGDYIVTLPALEALRHRYPDAEIVLLGRHWHSVFLSGRPGPVDRAIVVPYSRGIYDPPDRNGTGERDLPAFFRNMREENFDLAFQLHGGGRNSNPFVRNLCARLTVGARTPDADVLDRWIPYRPFQNEKLRLLEVVSLAGARPVSLEPRIAITEQDLREADVCLPPDSHPLVVINPGCRDSRRRWPPRKFAVVADALASKGARIVLNGDSGDHAAVDETLSWMRNAGQSLCGVLSLGGLAGLLSRAQLCVSNDSGPLHLASAVGTPAVGIFWCGNVLTYGPTRCSRTVVHISWRMHCPVCGAHCETPGCRHDESFVSDVAAEDVIASAVELFTQEH